jgi:hypothetical protein
MRCVTLWFWQQESCLLWSKFLPDKKKTAISPPTALESISRLRVNLCDGISLQTSVQTYPFGQTCGEPSSVLCPTLGANESELNRF